MSDTVTQHSSIDFSLLLASSVHDIKNSLGMLLTSLDDVIDISEEQSPQQQKNYSILRSEASRINQSLICLLGLYRLQCNQLSPNLTEVFIQEFLEEQVAAQQLLFDVNKITVNIDCDDSLTGYFDENLIAGVISNVLVNGAKYTHDELTISAHRAGKGIEIVITDNGGGYPQAIIDNIDNHQRGIDFTSGSTNLGLFFAQQIAQAHQCKGENGHIVLRNLDNGGGCFSLTLP